MHNGCIYICKKLCKMESTCPEMCSVNVPFQETIYCIYIYIQYIYIVYIYIYIQYIHIYIV